MKNSIFQDIVRVIDEFLTEEIDLSDVKKWLITHPCITKGICAAGETAILEQFRTLTNRPINIFEWQNFRDRLKNL